MSGYFNKRNIFSSFASIVLSVAFVASVTFAATTISTDISTGGTLAVTGVSTLAGQLQASSTALFGGNVTTYAGVTVGSATAINSLDGTILFKAQSSDPTGVTQGTIYYNSTSKVLKLFDGTSWFTTGTTTSGISLSGSRLQLADLTTQYMALGTSSTLVASPLLMLEATSTNTVPLTIAAKASQTADLLGIRNSDNAKLLYINSAGALFGSSTLQITGAVTTYGAVTLGDAGADAIIITGNASTTNALTVGSNFYVGGNATTTALTGAFSTQGNITGLGALSITGNATTSSLYVGGNFNVNGYATTTSAGASLQQGKFAVGTTTTPTSEISADGTATTTIGAFSSTSLVGGCIQLKGTNGLSYRMYVGVGEPATTTVSGKTGFLAVWEAGSCK